MVEIVLIYFGFFYAFYADFVTNATKVRLFWAEASQLSPTHCWSAHTVGLAWVGLHFSSDLDWADWLQLKNNGEFWSSKI